MPSILIDVRNEYSHEQEVALMEAVHSALREAFKIPEWDRNMRLVVHAPHRFACLPDREKPELYTHISIDCFAGRSVEAKRNLYQAIVRNLEALGIPKNHVSIVLHETSKENWGIRGGQAACDVDIGLKIEV